MCYCLENGLISAQSLFLHLLWTIDTKTSGFHVCSNNVVICPLNTQSISGQATLIAW